MSSNTENTEAKLAAYIDGQLDPNERAQIEQYLQSNPEHRKLLADLIAQRETLRSLPREKAPPDVYDAIQAQLERSVLLDDSAASAAPVLRHSRRSQLFGLAAMLLLAVGLGVVLYFALPSTKPHAIDVASTAGSAASQPTTSSTSDADLDAVLPAPTDTVAKRRAAFGKRSLQPLPSAGAQPQDLAKAVGGAAIAAAAQPSNPSRQLVLLVSTDDPSKVHQQVESYLASNHIRWDSVNAPADQVFYSRVPTAAPVPTQKAEAAAAPAGTAERAPANDLSRSAEIPPPPATSESLTGQIKSHDVQPEQQKQEAFSPATSESRAQGSPSPTTQPQPATPSPADAGGIDKDASRPSYIIARGMTRDQAIELTDALSVDRTAQRARLIGRLPAQPVAAKKLEVQRDELKLSQAQSTPQTQPTTDTTVSLTSSAPAVAEKPQAATEPTTRAADQQEDAELKQFAATTTPTTVPAEKASLFATTAPTTQPAGPTVDVVILVEDDSPLPTTVPTAPPASQPAPTTQPAPPAD